MGKLFVHIPKCAGTTFRQIFSENNIPVIIDDQNPFHVKKENCENDIRDYLIHKIPINNKFIMGHFYPSKYHISDDVKIVTILRDPIERLKSHYMYWRQFHNNNQFELVKNGSSGKIAEKVIDMNALSFEEFSMFPEWINYYNNYFFNFSIERFDYIGVQENFDTSYYNILEHLNLKPIKSLPRKINVTAGKNIIINEDLKTELRRKFFIDYDIYNYAIEKFHT